MKPPKAIEILEELPENVNNVLDYDQLAALKLGIEALKRHRDRSGFTFAGMMEPLPGEATEGEQE